VKVGEVTLVVPNFKQEHIDVTARILPEFVNDVAVKGSHFWLTEPEIGIGGVKNLGALVSKSISVEPGHGAEKFKFDLAKSQQAEKGVSFTLLSEQRGSGQVGTPILYRQMEVGSVTDVRLGEFADRIVTKIEIQPEYAYLVRQNSVFWNVSGVDVSIGITGANIKAGTFDSLVRGGIAFSTPEQSQIPPAAKDGQSFYLYPQADENWSKWRTAIPKP
jgi:paraquat-inducible protein B